MNDRVVTIACAFALLVAGCETPRSSRERGEAPAQPAPAVEASSTKAEPVEPEESPEPVAAGSGTTEASSPAPAKTVPAKSVLVPAGTTMLVRTNGVVDSTSMVPGHRVTATLTEDVSVAESVVLSKGTLVYARLVRTGEGDAKVLALKPTDILFAGRLVPIATTELAVHTEEQSSPSALDVRRPELELPVAAPPVSLAGPVVKVPEGTVLQFRLEKTLDLGS